MGVWPSPPPPRPLAHPESTLVSSASQGGHTAVGQCRASLLAKPVHQTYRNRRFMFGALQVLKFELQEDGLIPRTCREEQVRSRGVQRPSRERTPESRSPVTLVQTPQTLPSGPTLFDTVKAKDMPLNPTKMVFPITLRKQNPDTYCCQKTEWKSF